MFIYIKIINLSYGNVLFYVIAIKKISDTCHFLLLWQKLWVEPATIRREPNYYYLEHKMPGNVYYAVVLCI